MKLVMSTVSNRQDDEFQNELDVVQFALAKLTGNKTPLSPHYDAQVKIDIVRFSLEIVVYDCHYGRRNKDMVMYILDEDEMKTILFGLQHMLNKDVNSRVHFIDETSAILLTKKEVELRKETEEDEDV